MRQQTRSFNAASTCDDIIDAIFNNDTVKYMSLSIEHGKSLDVVYKQRIIIEVVKTWPGTTNLACINLGITTHQMLAIIGDVYDACQGDSSIFYSIYPKDNVNAVEHLTPTEKRYFTAVENDQDDIIEHMRSRIDHVKLWGKCGCNIRIAAKTDPKRKEILYDDFARYVSTADLKSGEDATMAAYVQRIFNRNVWKTFMRLPGSFTVFVKCLRKYPIDWDIKPSPLRLLKKYVEFVPIERLEYAVRLAFPTDRFYINWPIYIKERCDLKTFADGIFMKKYPHTYESLITLYDSGVDPTKVRVSLNVIKECMAYDMISRKHIHMFADTIIACNLQTKVCGDEYMWGEVYRNVVGEIVRRRAVDLDHVDVSFNKLKHAFRHGYATYVDLHAQNGLFMEGMDLTMYTAHVNEDNVCFANPQHVPKLMAIINRRGHVDRPRVLSDVILVLTSP